MWLRRGLLAAAALVSATALAPAQEDPRVEALRRFFAGPPSSPALAALAEEFVASADRHSLDWRLLPALAAVETASGRAARGNNLFAWGRQRFASYTEAIRDVAAEMGGNARYRGKSTREKLIAFNRRYARTFPARVEKVMERIGPTAIN